MRSYRLERVAMKHHNTREVMPCAPVAIGDESGDSINRSSGLLQK